MKKIITFVFLMFIFHICSAPVSSLEQKKEQLRQVIYEYYLLQYNEELDIFINHLGYKESKNNWKIINDINCFGEWQFAHSTLIHLGYGHITPEDFKINPSIFPRETQIKVLKTLIRVNEISLIPYKEYIGKTINGVIITKSGLLAGMHLGGMGGIKLYLLSNGNIDNKDLYGSKISEYIKEFSIYELSEKHLDEKLINEELDITLLLQSRYN